MGSAQTTLHDNIVPQKVAISDTPPQLLQRQWQFSRSPLALRLTRSRVLSLLIFAECFIANHWLIGEAARHIAWSMSIFSIIGNRGNGERWRASRMRQSNRERCCATRPNFRNTLIINIGKKKKICARYRVRAAAVRACARDSRSISVRQCEAASIPPPPLEASTIDYENDSCTLNLER